MALKHDHLDDRTRKLMLEEIEGDIAANKLYISDNLSEQGRKDYPSLLKSAASHGDDSTLANEISGRLNSHEKPRQLKTGGFSKPPVMRSNAHEMLAEGEFIRFYMRAICRRAIEDGVSAVVVYRAKEVMNARSASEDMLGKHISPNTLLEDLRTHIGVDTALGLPPGPNSGLCIRLP